MTSAAAFDVVLVGYRAADCRAALRLCQRAFGSGRGGRRVLVLNRPGLAEEIGEHAPAWETVRGSNRLAEFSGWQEGLDHLGAAAGRGPGVAFVNDSGCTHRHFTSARTAAFVRTTRAAHGPRLVGFQDEVPGRQLTIADLELEAWTSTYCFALTSDALRRLRCDLYDQALVAACVPGGRSEDTFFDRLSPDLEAHLRYWLFGGGWYGSEPLSSSNAARFQLKARCIVAELLLSARCRFAGVEARDPFRAHPQLERLDRILRRLRRVLADSHPPLAATG